MNSTELHAGPQRATLSPVLYQPLTLRCGLVIPNRIALAPMTNLQSAPDGLLGDDELAFLARRAEGGFGLIETCAAYVAHDGKAWNGELAIDRDACIPGLTRLATRLREAGTVSIVQLFHGGMRADRALTGQATWTATATHDSTPGVEPSRTATEADLRRVIDQFAAAAERAQAAGFDGVELHGAHGYLLSQFLSRSNTRSDGWGGDRSGRARLLREVMQAVRSRVSPKFAVGVRLSLEDFGQAKGMDLDDSLAVARGLATDGADFIHASLWDATRMTAKRPDQHPITVLRESLPRTVAVFACGKIWSRADADAALGRGADAIAVGRAAILNPDWPKIVASSEDESGLVRPPITRAGLLERAVSPAFADYLTRWKNLVAD